eukprot:gene9595-biopygen18226
MAPSQFNGAELLAKKHGIMREEMDAFGAESHRRAPRRRPSRVPLGVCRPSLCRPFRAVHTVPIIQLGDGVPSLHRAEPPPAGRNGCGRAPDASHTIEFEETDASRTRPQSFLPAGESTCSLPSPPARPRRAFAAQKAGYSAPACSSGSSWCSPRRVIRIFRKTVRALVRTRHSQENDKYSNSGAKRRGGRKFGLRGAGPGPTMSGLPNSQHGHPFPCRQKARQMWDHAKCAAPLKAGVLHGSVVSGCVAGLLPGGACGATLCTYFTPWRRLRRRTMSKSSSGSQCTLCRGTGPGPQCPGSQKVVAKVVVSKVAPGHCGPAPSPP